MIVARRSMLALFLSFRGDPGRQRDGVGSAEASAFLCICEFIPFHCSPLINQLYLPLCDYAIVCPFLGPLKAPPLPTWANCRCCSSYTWPSLGQEMHLCTYAFHGRRASNLDPSGLHPQWIITPSLAHDLVWASPTPTRHPGDL